MLSKHLYSVLTQNNVSQRFTTILTTWNHTWFGTYEPYMQYLLPCLQVPYFQMSTLKKKIWKIRVGFYLYGIKLLSFENHTVHILIELVMGYNGIPSGLNVLAHATESSANMAKDLNFFVDFADHRYQLEGVLGGCSN